MADKTTRFIVTKHPPWYSVSPCKVDFSCESTEGLFDKVVSLMTLKQEGLSEREKRYKPKTIYKIIRSMVIHDINSIKQNPSPLLLLALMDLVDIEGGNGLDSMASEDKAGVKHLLLSYGNYTAFCIPNKELTSGGKKVIPVVTQFSERHNLYFYDRSRSMLGTYNVCIATPEKGNLNSYFLQEVLFVPGPESLKVLKMVTGNRFDFWDMALEVPTHFTALTPSFQQIQPVQLLRTECISTPSGQNDTDVQVSQMEEVHPMCCVIGKDSGTVLTKKRESSMDYFTEHQMKCDLKRFHYKNGEPRTVYFRRSSSKLLDGKRVNLVPVVTLRKNQIQAPLLYVSTTLRFYRAVKQYCVKGNGELARCWSDTLNELKRSTFITGPEMYQEIYNPALTAFVKRVNPNSWCNYLPKYLESRISKDPVMVEVVEMGIELMDNKIPNAFPVAELLLCCPIEKVQEYLKFWKMYSSDNIIHMIVKQKHVSMVEEQIRKDWEELAQVATGYIRKRYGDAGNAKKVSDCKELFSHQTPDNVVKALTTWHALAKHDVSKIRDKELVNMYTNAKVLFLKLRAYHNKLKECLKVGGEGEQSRLPFPRSTDSAQREDAGVSSKRLAEVEGKHCDDESMTAGVSKTNDTLYYSIVTPKSIPISTWIKNISTLLTSEPWLNGVDDVRRDAVCTLLGLDNTLLHKSYGDILRDWVISNQTVVSMLKRYRLKDRLSTALVDCLESMSSDHWRRKVLLSFQQSTRKQPRGHSDQSLVVKPYSSRKMNPKGTAAQSNKDNVCDKRLGKCAKNQAPLFHHRKAVKMDRKAPKSNKSSASKSSAGSETRRAHSLCRRHSDNGEQEERSREDDEYEIPGEDLEASRDYDDSESVCEYDYNDNFIDDVPTKEDYYYSSKKKEDDKVFCAQGNGRTKKDKHKIKNANQAHKYNKRMMSNSESEEDPCSTKPTHSAGGRGGHRGIKENTRKRVLQSDSDESTRPDVKRVKCTKENKRWPDKIDKHSSMMSPKVVKEMSFQHFDKEDKSHAKKRQYGNESDRKSPSKKRVKRTAMNTRTPDQYSHKHKISESDINDYQGEEKQLSGVIKGGKPSNIKCSPISEPVPEQEVRRSKERKVPQTPTLRALEQQKACKKQEPGNCPGAATSSRQSPACVSDSQERSRILSREAPIADKWTAQTVWPTDTLEQEQFSHKGEYRCDDIEADRVATSSHQSPAVVSHSQVWRILNREAPIADKLTAQTVRPTEPSNYNEEYECDNTEENRVVREDHRNHPVESTSTSESTSNSEASSSSSSSSSEDEESDGEDSNFKQRLHKPESTPIQKLEKTEPERAREPDHTVWPTDTLERQLSSNQGQGNREGRRLAREDHPNHSAASEPASAASESSEDEAQSDVDSDCDNSRLDHGPKSIESGSECETYSGEINFMVSM